MKTLLAKLWNKAKNASEPVKASFWFTICNVINKCIQLLTVPIFTRIMSQDEYGEFTTFLSWQGILIILATLSLYANVFNNGMLKYKSDKQAFTSALQGLTTTITIVLAVIGFCFGDFVTAKTGLSMPLFFLLMAEIMIMPGFEFWAAGERFDYKYKKVVAVTIAIAVLNPLVGLIMVLASEQKGTARIISVLVVPIVVYFFLYVRNFRNGKKFFVKEYWKYALILALPLVPHYLSQMLLNEMDRLMIRSMCGKSEAALYSVAYSAAMVMQIVGKAIQSSMTPWIYKNIKQGNTAPIKDTMNKLCILVAGFNFLIICFAPEVIFILGGKKYMEAIYVIPPVVVSSFLIFLYSMFCTLEFYYEQTKAMMVVSVLGAILNFVLNYLLIPMYGYKAAGYTTLASYLFFVLVHYFVMRTALKKNGHEKGIYDGRFIAIFTTAFVVFGIAMNATYYYPLVRYGILLLLAVAVFIKRNVFLSLLKKYF